MANQININNNINWDNIFDKMIFNHNEIKHLASMIIEGMTDRIINQITADGRPLDANSASWQAQKQEEGKGVQTLIYTGGLKDVSTYQIKINDEKVSIELEPGYRDIHLNLIEISEATGKNYKDWFGIAPIDIEIIMDEARYIIQEKLRLLRSR